MKDANRSKDEAPGTLLFDVLGESLDKPGRLAAGLGCAAAGTKPARQAHGSRGSVLTESLIEAARSLFESNAQALVLLDREGGVLRTNARARELLQRRSSETSFDSLPDFFDPADSRRIAEWLAAPSLNENSDRIAATLMSGSSVRLVWHGLPLSSDARILRLEEIPVAPPPESPVSQRQTQSPLLQTEKMAALGALVSGIAHELNNPLTAIMGYAQLLLGHGLRPAQLAEAKNIYQEAGRARRIVKNLLFFARETKPERVRADLNEIVERTLALRSYELKIENIVVDCSLESDLPPTMADPYQLQQVVLNLLINAEQALLQSRGQGRVAIHTRRAPRNRIALEVSDDGPGVPAEIALRIFDPFFSTKPPGVGTGLGLSIVYGIVKQHGGEISFENQAGGGTKFVIEIPIVAVTVPEASAERPPVAPPRAAMAGSRILVVEDEATVAHLILDVLEEEGHHVEAVLDSQEGLSRLSRNHYDAILCDLRMPRLDGPAFYDALVRAGSPMKDRILFITGDTVAPRTREFLEPRGLPHLDKPFLVEELKLAVLRILDPCHRPSPSTSVAPPEPVRERKPEALVEP